VDPSGAPTSARLHAELVAVVITVAEGEPAVLAPGDPPHLPAGPLRDDHHSLQAGVRAFAEEQTGHALGYVEQLYTFADLGRTGRAQHAISVSYLGLGRAGADDTDWVPVYELLPWEDRRHGDDAVRRLAAALDRWGDRGNHLFGLGGNPWRPELALQRYELLWQAGLVAESDTPAETIATGPRMLHDHRRILATGLSRVRSALQYRPVVFELLPATFTLGQLQETVEALAGQAVHKQNFRRLVAQQELVEPTGATSNATGGRPAQLYRYRREVFEQRQHVGTKLPLPRAH
jgi:hypothetical protein